MQQVDHFVGQIEKLLPASDLPVEVHDEAMKALADVKKATTTKDEDRVRQGLAYLRRVFADAGDHVIKIAIDQIVSKMLANDLKIAPRHQPPPSPFPPLPPPFPPRPSR